MPRKRQEFLVKPARVIKRHRSISLDGTKFTLTDLRSVLSEAVADGYDDSARVTLYAGLSDTYSMLTISEDK